MLEQKALAIDLQSGFYRVERINDRGILGPVDFGFREWSRHRALCFGGGPFMGSILPGSNRLIFTGPSPCWDGFYISTMGGAAHTFDNVGIDFVSLRNRCAVPSVLVLQREGQEQVELVLVPVEPVAIWAEGRRGSEGEIEQGFVALQRYLWDRFCGRFSNPPRVLAVGPAALRTDFGAIGSSKAETGGLTHVDCWAGRGGLGSRMAQHHNLFGIVLGGSHIDRDFDDRKLADVYFKRRYDMRMILKDKDATRKYRYEPELQTGGTFGVNFTKLKDRLFFFNYRSVEWPTAARLELHRRLIVEHYLKQFNEETIANKKFAHCGEPCLAVCKKMWGPYKKDYEPYQALGPNAGIFDQRAAEQVVWLCDSMGFDTIQVGGVVSWLMELVDEGMLDPGSCGLTERPVFAPETFDAERDSRTNAAVACGLVRAIVDGRGELDFQRGALAVARRIGVSSGKAREVLDRLVVNCAGERGWMVPNQYWVPGMFSPMPIMGKYFEYYGDDFVPPRTLGRLNAERMSQELFLDNMGFCRFHRAWAEELLPEIFRDFWEEEVDLRAHHLALTRRINAGNTSAYWRSRRVEALLHGYLRRKKEEGTQRPELDEWLARFESDRTAAARDFWYEIRKGVDEAVEEPLES
jgi:glyceraldehyde-3-phosphate dehydrogenase (ferredoxin)